MIQVLPVVNSKTKWHDAKAEYNISLRLYPTSRQQQQQ